jgi:hypothetical protein
MSVNSGENRRLEDYEPPALVEIGTVRSLTQTGDWGDHCFFGIKKLGKPDYMFHIAVPITNCS